MENNVELARLEQFIDKLLDRYNVLKKNFHELEATLAQREQEIEELKAQIRDLQAERTEVGGRVASLIGRIEEWESTQEDGSADTSREESSSGGVQANLFASEGT